MFKMQIHPSVFQLLVLVRAAGNLVAGPRVQVGGLLHVPGPANEQPMFLLTEIPLLSEAHVNVQNKAYINKDDVQEGSQDLLTLLRNRSYMRGNKMPHNR